MIGSTLVDEPRLLQFFNEFPCRHELFIRMMRIIVKN